MTLSESSRKIMDCCAENKWTLSVAESCTGGLLGGCLTEIPGSSAYFLGGVIAYSNTVKTSVLGVSPETLSSKGAVSGETALAMARGAARVTGADCGISITGVAGPDGGTPDKPVGTVWFSVLCPHGETSRSYLFSGGRDEVRAQAVQTAMDLFLETAGLKTR